MKRAWMFGIAAAGLLLCEAAPVSAAPVSFQGRLQSAGGAPVNRNDVDLTVHVYLDASDQTAEQTVDLTVDVSNGLYSATLDLRDDLLVHSSLQLGIEVDGEALNGRIPLRPSPSSWYAHNAASVGGLSASQLAPADHDHDGEYLPAVGGNVGGDLTVTGVLSVDGAVKLGSAATCNAAAEGSLRYNSSASRVEVCDGSAWSALSGNSNPGGGGGGDVIITAGGGLLSDTARAHCQAFVEADDAPGDGAYLIDPDGDGSTLFPAFCLQSVEDGGWTLLFNLASRDFSVRHYDDTAFWQGTNTLGEEGRALTREYKGAAYFGLEENQEYLVLLHDRGRILGRARYEAIGDASSQSFQQLMLTASDLVASGARASAEGTVGATQNTARAQAVFGDIFVDHPEPLVFNKQSGWAADVNRTRVATTLSTSTYGHTYAGVGGYHVEGGWNAYFESAPISPYCDLTNIYGEEASYTAGVYRQIGSNFPPAPSCRWSPDPDTFEFLPVDVAFFARGGTLNPVAPFDGSERIHAALTCATLKNDFPATQSGVYWVNPNGGSIADAFEVFCEMELDGGGYTLLMNLPSRDDQTRDYNETAFWTGSDTVGTAGYTEEYKAEAYSRLESFNELLILHHDGGLALSHAVYDVLAAYDSQSLQTTMASASNATLTNVKARGVGATPYVRNNARPQTADGDIFIDNSEAVVINKTSGWAADSNLTRIATTLSNSSYTHTFAGIGGVHREGGWNVDFETAPISPYCDITFGYGDEATHTVGNYQNVGGNYVYRASCRQPGNFEFLAIDTAILVR